MVSERAVAELGPFAALRSRAAALLGTALALLPLLANAESAWVRDELRLNVRTGPGVEYRILSVIKTGDQVEVLDGVEEWTKVRYGEAQEGWIPAGYLQPEQPAQLVVSANEREIAQLQARVGALTNEAKGLRSDNQRLAAAREDHERLARESLELRAAVRWPEWIAGASILGVGMALGAILHGSATRRPNTRIRL